MKNEEFREQKALMEYAGIKAKTDLRWGLIFSIPNGGHRHIAVAKRMKAEGVKSGVPDLFLPVQCKGFGGLFLEMKKQKYGRITDNQKDWFEKLRKQGYKVCLAEGFEKAKNMVEWYLNGDNSVAREPIKYVDYRGD